MDNILVLRSIYPSLQKHLSEKEITVLIGPRQSGKTTLIKQLIAGLKNAYYFNLDVTADYSLFQNQSDVIQFIKNRGSADHKIYLFVDEAQRLVNPGLFFKGIYDLELAVKMVLTGSSSLEFRAKINEPLTGRKRLFKLLPLSFLEYLSAKEPEILPFLLKDDVYTRQRILSRMEEFIIFGGYPKICLTNDINNKPLLLQEIYDSYIDKDVVGYLKIKNSFAFGKFVKILSQEIGNLFNLEGVSREISVKNATLKNYLASLENTFICQRVLPFFSSARTEIRKMPKIYFYDTGLRNFAKEWRDFSLLAFKERQDKGALLENFIFSELQKHEILQLNFWRTKDDAEVDFVVSIKNKIIPVEIKTKFSKNNGEMPRGYISFLNKYHPEIGFSVSFSKLPERKIKKTLIRYVLPYELIPLLKNL